MLRNLADTTQGRPFPAGTARPPVAVLVQLKMSLELLFVCFHLPRNDDLVDRN